MAATMIATDRTPWYDAKTGVLDRRIFSDTGIYQEELQRIFARAWNFVCHESQLPQSGSFFMNYIGEDQVIAVRDRTGAINVLLNSCSHRGNSVCRAEQGRTNSFLCSYHGWNYDLDGRLVAIPGQEAFYRNDVDKSKWGLGKAAQVANYRGFVFATLDPTAPPLEDYLGWVGRLGIDMLASNGDLEVIDGVQKNRLKCNWKLAVDNLYDWYHVKISHGSALRIGYAPEEAMAPMSQMVILGEYGHGIGGPGITQAELDEYAARMKSGGGEPKWYDMMAARRLDPRVREMLGPVGNRSFGHPNIFPNLWITQFNQVCLRVPRGPYETELWWFTLMPKGYSGRPTALRHLYGESHVRPGGSAGAGRRRELEPLDARCERRGYAAAAVELWRWDAATIASKPIRLGKAASKRSSTSTASAGRIRAGRNGCTRIAGRS